MEKLLVFITLSLTASLTFLMLAVLIKEKKMQKDYYKERGGFIKRIAKYSWYQWAKGYMKEAGNPIRVEVFILLHITLLAFVVYSSLEGMMLGEFGDIITHILRLFLLGVLPLHLILNRRIRQRQNKIRLELCNIQDIMYFQTKIGTPDDVVLAYAARVANDPIKEPLLYIANAPKVKKSYEEALERFRNLSGITEVQAFSFALAQKQEMGVSEKSFKTQANLLKRNKRIRRKIIRQYKRTKLLVAAMLLFMCYVLLVSVPIVQEVMANLDLMFR